MAVLPKSAGEVRAKLNDEIPIRFGSPLYSKLQKKYWELHDVSKWPLVIAIADFHAKGSMLWTSTGLQEYLYGTRHDFSFNSDCKLIISPLKIETHKLGNKEIPSGFFFQPKAEHISAVLFSNSGTISKFTRMGKLAGLGDPTVKLMRAGTRYTHDSNAALPTPFAHEVEPGKCTETWGEGISLFHNPNALVPLPEELFPSAAHHKFDNGQIRSHIPEFHPFGSVTVIMIPEAQRSQAALPVDRAPTDVTPAIKQLRPARARVPLYIRVRNPEAPVRGFDVTCEDLSSVLGHSATGSVRGR